MKARAIGYWVATGLVALSLILSGAGEVVRLPQNITAFAQLGYPVYFMVLLGVWKVLGGIAILAPRFPRLKEWAYAGIFIDFTSASVSHAASGEELWRAIVPVVFVAILFASWALRPQSRTLGVLFPAGSEQAPAPSLGAANP